MSINRPRRASRLPPHSPPGARHTWRHRHRAHATRWAPDPPGVEKWCPPAADDPRPALLATTIPLRRLRQARSSSLRCGRSSLTSTPLGVSFLVEEGRPKERLSNSSSTRDLGACPLRAL